MMKQGKCLRLPTFRVIRCLTFWQFNRALRAAFVRDAEIMRSATT